MPFLLATCVAVLSLSTLLAVLPALLSSPRLDAFDEGQLTPAAGQWLVVRSATGSWYLNGDAVSAAVLSRALRQSSPKPSVVLLMPSSTRTAADVAGDLRWLRAQSNSPIRIERPEGAWQP